MPHMKIFLHTKVSSCAICDDHDSVYFLCSSSIFADITLLAVGQFSLFGRAMSTGDSIRIDNFGPLVA